MPRPALCLSLILLAVPIASASAQGIGTGAETSGAIRQSAGPIFRSGVDVVALSVTVTDLRQKYVPGLRQADFEVYEDGVLQDLAFFATDEVPLDLAILLDTSSSMLNNMPVVHEAAVAFARTLRASDRGAVVEFKDNVQLLQPLTADIARLESAIRQTTALGGTSLYTALYVALKDLAREHSKTGELRRQAIAVLSDGQDTRSLIAFDDVLELARRSAVAIYTISLASGSGVPQGHTGTRFLSESDHQMRTLAQETGGRAFFPLDIKDLAPVYGVIAEELANQYALGYVSTNPTRNGALRRVMVRLPSRPDARPRTRLGYLAARLLQQGAR